MLRKGNIIITHKVKPLASSWTHAIGLMFKKRLKDEAYIFIFRKPRKDMVHMLFMRFAIDIVWLNEKKQVLDVYENAVPWQKMIRFRYASKYMIELPSGLVKKYGIKKNDRLTF
jgi:hypothetical protein